MSRGGTQLVRKRVRHPEKGHRLLAAREHAGLTQEELCRRVSALPGPELDQAHYSKWENGYTQPENAERLKRVASVVGVSPAWLYFGAPDGGENPSWYHPPVKHSHGVAPETHHTKRRDNTKRREG